MSEEQDGEFSLKPKKLSEMIIERDIEQLEQLGGVDSIMIDIRTERETGISNEEAPKYSERIRHFGSNRFKKPKKPNFVKLFIGAIADPVVIVLIILGAALVIINSAIPRPNWEEEGELPQYLGWIEGASILLAVLIVGCVSAVNDYSKERKFQKLDAESNQTEKASVIRGGEEGVMIKPNCVLVGDIVELQTGYQIPGDGLVLESETLRIDESQLTGETDLVKKDPKVHPFLFSGCKVMEGTGRMVVLSVGKYSQWGRMIRKIMKKKREDTPLQKKLQCLARLIGCVGVTFAALTLFILWTGYIITKTAENKWSGEWTPQNCSTVSTTGGGVECESISGDIKAFLAYGIIAITIIAVAVPEGLPLAVTISLAYSVRRMLKDNNLVRTLASCETMGGCTVICSDKTGTLTKNEMNVVMGFFFGKEYLPKRLRDEEEEEELDDSTSDDDDDEDEDGGPSQIMPKASEFWSEVEKEGLEDHFEINEEELLKVRSGGRVSKKRKKKKKRKKRRQKKSRRIINNILGESDVVKVKMVEVEVKSDGTKNITTVDNLSNSAFLPVVVAVDNISEEEERSTSSTSSTSYFTSDLTNLENEESMIYLLSESIAINSTAVLRPKKKKELNPALPPHHQFHVEKSKTEGALLLMCSNNFCLPYESLIRVRERYRTQGLKVRGFPFSSSLKRMGTLVKIGMKEEKKYQLIRVIEELNNEMFKKKKKKKKMEETVDVVQEEKRSIEMIEQEEEEEIGRVDSFTVIDENVDEQEEEEEVIVVDDEMDHVQVNPISPDSERIRHPPRYSDCEEEEGEEEILSTENRDEEEEEELEGGQTISEEVLFIPAEEEEEIYRYYLKGAGEIVLEKCDRLLTPDGSVQLITNEMRCKLERCINKMAVSGKRTITLAFRDISKENIPVLSVSSPTSKFLSNFSPSRKSKKKDDDEYDEFNTTTTTSTSESEFDDSGDEGYQRHSSNLSTTIEDFESDENVKNEQLMQQEKQEEDEEEVIFVENTDEKIEPQEMYDEEVEDGRKRENVSDSDGEVSKYVMEEDFTETDEEREMKYEFQENSGHLVRTEIGEEEELGVEVVQETEETGEIQQQENNNYNNNIEFLKDDDESRNNNNNNNNNNFNPPTLLEVLKNCEQESIERHMTLICIVGIQDPLRDDVQGAVRRCQNSGIRIRMVTGDNALTARTIAEECGILFPVPTGHPRPDSFPGGLVMEGPEFRKLYDTERRRLRDEIVPRLDVLSRSSPEDKYKLVTLLRKSGHVVAVTGDGTNDAPALAEADVGLAMGITGTSVAKQASDIIILDDRFSSIVESVKWGRSIYENIRKFIQFQVTVNVVALLLTVISAITEFIPFGGDGDDDHSVPLTAIQLLWVNLIMDTFAALALATEKPENSLMNRPPYGKDEQLINTRMWCSILTQSAFQLFVLLGIYYSGPYIFNDSDMMMMTRTSWIGNIQYSERKVINTMVFHTFVFCQIFNEFCCRKINFEWNICKSLHKSCIFIFVVTFTAIVQIFIVQLGAVHSVGYAIAKTTGLDWYQHLICIAMASLTIPVHYVKTLFARCYICFCVCRGKSIIACCSYYLFCWWITKYFFCCPCIASTRCKKEIRLRINITKKKLKKKKKKEKKKKKVELKKKKKKKLR